MRGIICVIGLMLVCQQVTAQPDTILHRYRQYLFSKLKVTPQADQLASSLGSDGRWPDIDYSDKSAANWKPLHHLGRLREMAFAYVYPSSKFYHEQTIKHGIVLGLADWARNKYTSANWWHNEIGAPQLMRDIIILLRADLDEQQLADALQIMNQYKLTPQATGANLAWSADLAVHYGLLTGNDSLARRGRDRIIDEIKITKGDGVQPDYSFHQHGARLQMYQYGAAFLLENIRLAWEFRNTSLAFPGEKINLLTDFIFNGWQWMTRGINTVPGTMDRSVSRRNALHSSDLRGIIPYLIELVPASRAKWEALARRQNGLESLKGFRYFPYSDFTAYQQDNFSFFLKSISSRTLSSESINGENVKGHLLNSGDAYYVRDGQEYFNLMPAWDWEHLPGVTSFKGAEQIVRRPFTGSVSDGQIGLTSMDYIMRGKDPSDSIAARKSWFCFDNKIISLVAGLRGNQVDSAFTTLDQCRWRDEVTVNGEKSNLSEGVYRFQNATSVRHGNMEYRPLGASSMSLKLGEAKGAWKDINGSESEEIISEKVFMPVLQHGNLTMPQSFGFIVSYKKDGTSKEQEAAQDFRIIRNDTVCQSILFTDGTLMAAFFQPGQLQFGDRRLAVDKACLVLIHGSQLFVSDPKQVEKMVSVKYNSRQYHIQLPGNGFTTKGYRLSR